MTHSSAAQSFCRLLLHLPLRSLAFSPPIHCGRANRDTAVLPPE